MKVKTLVLGLMANCCYIVSDEDKNAILIDPAWGIKDIEKYIEDENLKPKAVFFTHGHFDHVKRADAIIKKFNIPAYIEEGDMKVSEISSNLLESYKGDKNFKIGKLDIEILHTPGHSEGSVCIKIGDNLFTGDTLFKTVCGRTDLPGSDPKKMQKSLKRLSQLPPKIKIWTGHEYNGHESSIEEELKTNHFLKMSITQ